MVQLHRSAGEGGGGQTAEKLRAAVGDAYSSRAGAPSDGKVRIRGVGTYEYVDGATHGVKDEGAGTPGGPPPGMVVMGARTAPKIVYASRTHSQISQVVKELKNTAYASRVRITVLGSREQLCVHPDVSQMPGGGMQNSACRALTARNGCVLARAWASRRVGRPSHTHGAAGARTSAGWSSTRRRARSAARWARGCR